MIEITDPFPDEARGMTLPQPAPAASPLAPGHRLRPLLGQRPGTLVVHEIYRSIQGESTFAGLPCVFVRLTACHLRCGYCDTPHAFHSGRAMARDEVLAEALRFDE